MILHRIAVVLLYGKVRDKTTSDGSTGDDGSLLYVHYLKVWARRL